MPKILREQTGSDGGDRGAGPRAGLSDLTGSMGKIQGLSATGRTNFE